MLTRIVMVTTIASLVLLFGAPKDAVACHRGDPHGSATSCDGGGGVDLTNLVMVDANGNVVGRISSLEVGHANVIVFTPDQRPFLLHISAGDLQNGFGFRDGERLYYEESGCPDTGSTYLPPGSNWPDIFYENQGFLNREIPI